MDNKGSSKKLKVQVNLKGDDSDSDVDSIKRYSVSSLSSDSSLDSDDREEPGNRNSFEHSYDLHVYDSPVWSYTGASSAQSPSHYTMESGYDPNRIPASVFGKSNPNEQWSVASNESLFSIRLGNGSFITRDISFAMNNNNNKSGELYNVSMPLPTVQEVSYEENNNRNSDSSDSSDRSVVLDLEKHEHKNDEESRKVETKVLDKTTMDHRSKEANNVPVVSYRSMESGRSFQFPILTNNGERISSSTVESEMHEKTEKQQQQPEKSSPPRPPPPPKAKKASKQGGRYCCFCFSCF